MINFKRFASLFLIISIVMTFGMTVIAEQTTPVVTISAASSTYVAGEVAEFNATITSNQIIDKAELYVNNEFYSVKYNCGTSFKCYYPIPKGALGRIYSFKMVAYDVLANSAASDEITVEVSENSDMTISFLGLPTTANIGEFNEIKAQIIDSDGISKTELYINDKLSENAICSSGESDTYSFTNFEKNIGNMKIEVKATDIYGAVSSEVQNVNVTNPVMKNVFTHPLTATTASGFTVNRPGGYTVTADVGNYIQVAQTGSGSGNAQLTCNQDDVSGVVEVEFDICFAEGFGNETLSLELGTAMTGGIFITQITGGGMTVNAGGTASREFTDVFTSPGWYTYKFVCDTATDEYSVFINNTEYLAADGGKFKLRHTNAETITSVTYHRFHIGLPDLNDTVKLKNIRINNEKDTAKVDSCTYDGNDISMVMANGIDGDSLTGNVSLYSKDENIAVSNVSYVPGTKTVTITPAKKLNTAIDYSIVLDSSVKDADGENIGYNSITPLKLPNDDFEITSVEFNEAKDSVGVTAKVSNSTPEDKNLIMIMTLYDENGVVQSVVPSVPLTVSSGSTNVSLTIAPVYSKGMTVKLFFLDNWTNNIAVKPYIYTK